MRSHIAERPLYLSRRSPRSRARRVGEEGGRRARLASPRTIHRGTRPRAPGGAPRSHRSTLVLTLTRDTARAMSQENVEMVRRLVTLTQEGVRTGDLRGAMDAAVAAGLISDRK